MQSVNLLIFFDSFCVDVNGLVEGEYPDDVDMLDGIVPTLPANHIYPPMPFAPIDPSINVGYSDASHFAPIALTNHRPELVHVDALPANQNNNSHVVANTEVPSHPFHMGPLGAAKGGITQAPSLNMATTAPLPPGNNLVFAFLFRLLAFP